MREEFCLYCEEDLYGDWLTTADGDFCNHSHAKHWKDKQRISDLESRNGELEFNDHTREILGRPCFACIHIAEALRAQGQTIPRKAEEEQAAVIYWLLSMYRKHGADWKKEAENYLSMLTSTKEQTHE